jgi:hypothetical protein
MNWRASMVRQFSSRIPPFAPGPLRESQLPSLDQVDRLCKGLHCVSLGVKGIDQADDYFHFLFVALTEDNGQSVFRRAIQEIPDAYSPAVGPHLSLMYSDRISEIDRLKISENHCKQLPDRLLFSKIQLVMPSTGNWRDLGCWQVRYTVQLAV